MRPTLPQALHDRGYRTMLAGKYLNSWPCVPRPEFDRWVCTSTPAPSNTALTHPYINVDGVWNQYGGYQPDVLATFATDFITQTPTDQPFFVMYTPTSPHLPADDPRYDDMAVSPPRGGAFNANMLTEGAPRFARRSALNADEIANSDANYVSMAHATRSLDDAMGAVLDSLGDRSRDTLVIFMSDNGFLYGEHRRVGKNDQWEESVNVPMVVRYPAVLSPDQSFVSRRARAERGHLGRRSPTCSASRGRPTGSRSCRSSSIARGCARPPSSSTVRDPREGPWIAPG